jgi:acetyl-CoA acyltransferase
MWPLLLPPPLTRAGTMYKDYLAVDLARFAMKGILDKTALDPSLIDYVNFGTVIQGMCEFQK